MDGVASSVSNDQRDVIIGNVLLCLCFGSALPHLRVDFAGFLWLAEFVVVVLHVLVATDQPFSGFSFFPFLFFPDLNARTVYFARKEFHVDKSTPPTKCLKSIQVVTQAGVSNATIFVGQPPVELVRVASHSLDSFSRAQESSMSDEELRLLLTSTFTTGFACFFFFDERDVCWLMWL